MMNFKINPNNEKKLAGTGHMIPFMIASV